MNDRKRGNEPVRFAGVLLRSPMYLMLAANLARDERLSRGQQASAWISLGYALSPIDLVPGFIPVAGQLDDLAVLIGGLKGVLRSGPPEVAREQLDRAGLSFETMDRDLGTVRDTAGWVGRKAGLLALRGVRALVNLALRPA